MKERRYATQTDTTIKIEQRAGDVPKIVGTAAVTYDGSPETEYQLWEGVRERIMPGAFDESLDNSDDVVALFNHDESAILGRTPQTLKLSTDSRGLHYEVEPPETQLGKQVTVAIQRGDIRGSSFAFQVTAENWQTQEDGSDVREITGVKLFDVSPVTRPAYEATSVGIRSDSDLIEVRKSYSAWKAKAETQKRIDRMGELRIAN